jgi:hypothetical protein
VSEDNIMVKASFIRLNSQGLKMKQYRANELFKVTIPFPMIEQFEIVLRVGIILWLTYCKVAPESLFEMPPLSSISLINPNQPRTGLVY